MFSYPPALQGVLHFPGACLLLVDNSTSGYSRPLHLVLGVVSAGLRGLQEVMAVLPGSSAVVLNSSIFVYTHSPLILEKRCLLFFLHH